MLAMHYAIPLKDRDQVAAVRARVAERGPLFDGLPGLHVKLFLIDPADPCYAPFYLWREPDAALAFLSGDFFKSIIDTFGRPMVRLLISDARDLPFKSGEALRLRIGPRVEAAAAIAFDPRHGEILSLSPPHAPGRLFEIGYRAQGAS